MEEQSKWAGKALSEHLTLRALTASGDGGAVFCGSRQAGRQQNQAVSRQAALA